MNEELKGLYEADVKSRSGVDWDDPEQVKTAVEQDKERRVRVEKLLESDKVKDATDYHHAALIFQHGDSPSDYRKANKLAKRAMEMGDERSKWLYAATLDRWLLSTGKPQKFGTQFKKEKNGDWELAQPIDKTVTDAERAQYNVPPLSEALSELKKKYKLD